MRSDWPVKEASYSVKDVLETGEDVTTMVHETPWGEVSSTFRNTVIPAVPAEHVRDRNLLIRIRAGCTNDFYGCRRLAEKAVRERAVPLSLLGARHEDDWLMIPVKFWTGHPTWHPTNILSQRLEFLQSRMADQRAERKASQLGDRRCWDHLWLDWELQEAPAKEIPPGKIAACYWWVHQEADKIPQYLHQKVKAERRKLVDYERWADSVNSGMKM